MERVKPLISWDLHVASSCDTACRWLSSRARHSIIHRQVTEMNIHDAQYRLIDHTADVGYVCRGSSLARLFETCALSLAAMMFGTEQTADAAVSEQLEIDAGSIDMLLVHFLNEILYLWETARLVPSDVNVESVTDMHMSARVRGERYDPAIHEVLCEVKAATYHMLAVEQCADGWKAEVIFDV